jgi:hypothetical protein
MFRTYTITEPIFGFWEETGLGFVIAAGENIELQINENTSGIRIGSRNGRRFLAFSDDVRRSILEIDVVRNLQHDGYNFQRHAR